MADANQYVFEHREIITLMIKKLDLHEGEWCLLLNTNFAAGMMGIGPDQSTVGFMVTIPNFGIQRKVAGMPEIPGSIFVDAAKVNPKKKK